MSGLDVPPYKSDQAINSLVSSAHPHTSIIFQETELLYILQAFRHREDV